MSMEGTVRAAGPRTTAGGLLRAALKLDVAVTGANAVAYVAGAALLADLFEVPAGALAGIGVFLAAYAAAVWRVATRPAMSVPAVWAVIGLNLAWVVDSLVLLALDGFSPSTAGQVWIALQAVAVLGFAGLQYAGLRRG